MHRSAELGNDEADYIRVLETYQEDGHGCGNNKENVVQEDLNNPIQTGKSVVSLLSNRTFYNSFMKPGNGFNVDDDFKNCDCEGGEEPPEDMDMEMASIDDENKWKKTEKETITSAELIAGANKKNREYLIFMIQFSIACFGAFYVLKKSAEAHASNLYTQRHWDYNRSVLIVGMNYSVYLWLNFFMKKDMYCCQGLCHSFFRLIRKLLVVYLWLFNTVMGAWLAYKSVRICKDNWWASKGEPFLTNESYPNAAFCWIFWINLFPAICILQGCLLPCICIYFGIMAITCKCKRIREYQISKNNKDAIFYYHWCEGNIGLAYFQYERFKTFENDINNYVNMMSDGYDNRHYQCPADEDDY